MKALAGSAFTAITIAAALAATASAATAASAPAIKSSANNPVPECATPGRLTAFLETRNKNLDKRFRNVATEYMRHGEAMRLRWDFAFFQMVVETGALSYTGDVEASQNNFAGLGATGNGVKGESFPDISTGVKAHLQHLAMYAGETVASPVAERTRKVQEWGVLSGWQSGFDQPITFTDLARKWAPTSKGYGRDIVAVAEDFMSGLCRDADPRPELVAEARGTKSASEKTKTAARSKSDDDAAAPAKSVGKAVAEKAIAEARAEPGAGRVGLGATGLADAAAAPATQPKADSTVDGKTSPGVAGPAVKILNPDAIETGTPQTSDGAAADGTTELAAVATGAGAGAAAAKDSGSGKDAKPSACRVWTASYGGAKAIVIKAKSGLTTNYTVLDVNEGSEKVEAQAYITAYAKGGETLGEFQSQSKALDKAFELCPEG